MINIEREEQTLMFIDARRGCGKTFLLNTVLAAVRLSEENAIAIVSASTSIAAILLDLGGTMHSKLKIPIDISENSVLSITVKSKTAKTIQNAKLIIIEGTMIDRLVLECNDRTFQDIMNNDLPFGNKTIILSGDFRQCLPVIPKAGKSEILSRTIKTLFL